MGKIARWLEIEKAETACKKCGKVYPSQKEARICRYNDRNAEIDAWQETWMTRCDERIAKIEAKHETRKAEIDEQVAEIVADARGDRLVCPHCLTRGRVRTRRVTRKNGISGCKAAGAVLTHGLSVIATGLSQKERVTEARCRACGSVWHF